MLTTEEIKKELDAAMKVKLECINSDSFINAYKGKYKKENKGILSSDLTVAGITGNDRVIEIRDCDYNLTSDELQYFRIKRPVPTFIELMNLVEDAKNKKLISSFCAINSDYQQEIMVIIKETTYTWGFNNQGIKGAYDLIDSLYTETFVIESKADIERVDKDRSARVTLLNGNTGTVQCVVEKRLSGGMFKEPHLYMTSIHTPVFFFTLKGATVTQKRGAL